MRTICSSRPTLDCPFDPALLDFPKTDLVLWAMVLEGQELSDYIAEVVVDTNLYRI